MIANYHTHTHRCNHAIGREEDYVKEALKAGLKILGCDAHSPQMLNVPQVEKAALGLVEAYGLNLLDTVELRSIHK